MVTPPWGRTLNPQAAATFYFRIKPKVKGTKKVLGGKRDLDEAIKGTDYEGLDLIPADFDYRNMDPVSCLRDSLQFCEPGGRAPQGAGPQAGFLPVKVRRRRAVRPPGSPEGSSCAGPARRCASSTWGHHPAPGRLRRPASCPWGGQARGGTPCSEPAQEA
ncbi:MAG TPA: hypothetical protein VKA55_06875, partial [Gammaproteobacteria bacterium]|nr:hypothetical protein [Gammaproteobacteria bacterium]